MQYNPIILCYFSNFKAGLNIVKANLGTGIQAIPNAFLHSGLLVGVLGVGLLGCIAVHCMNLLVKCSHEICKITGEASIDYASNAQKAFKYGFSGTRKLAAYMK